MGITVMVKQVDEAELKELIKGGGIVLVDYFTQWCGPCKIQHQVLEQLDKKGTGITIVSIDIDKNEQVAVDLGIRAIPTLQFFKNGKVVVFGKDSSESDRFVGLRPIDKLEEIIVTLKKED